MSARFILSLLALSFCAVALRAAPQITASETLFDNAAQAVIYKGNALLVDDDFVVNADEITFYRRENRAVAVGDVRISQEGFRYVGESLTYWPDKREFASTRFRIGAPPYFVEGESFSGSRGEIRFQNAIIYLNEPAKETPSLNAASGIIYPNDRIEAEGIRLGLGGRNILPFTIPATTQRFEDPGIRLRGSIGYSDDDGVFFRTETLAPVAPGLRLGAAIDGYTSRGVLAGPLADFYSNNPDNTFLTQIRTAYIDDSGNRRQDTLNVPIRESRYALSLHHHQRINQDLTLTTKLDRLSDSEFWRDFRDWRYEADPQPDNFAEIAYLWDNTYISAFTRIEMNEFSETREKLPEIRIDRLPTPIADTGIFYAFNASYARYRNSYENISYPPPPPPSFIYSPPSYLYSMTVVGTYDPEPPSQYSPTPAAPLTFADASFAETTIDFGVFDTGLYLSRPFKPTSWFTFTPVLGGRFTHYHDFDVDGPAVGTSYPIAFPRGSTDDSASIWQAEIGFDAEAQITGSWDIQSKLWKIDGLRHRLMPIIQYRWLPRDSYWSTEQGNAFYGQIAAPLRPELSLANQRIGFAQPDQNVLRFGLRNLLETRSKDFGARELLRLDLYQDINFHPQSRPFITTDEPNWAATYAEASITPASWLALKWEQRLYTEDLSSSGHRLTMTIKDGEQWSLSLYHEYLPRAITQDPRYFNESLEGYGANLYYQLLRNIGINIGLFYDSTLGEVTLQRYGIRQSIGRSWEVEYRVDVRDNSAREDDLRFSIALAYLNF